MKTYIAQQLAIEAAKLTELVARFAASYGQHYTLKPASPQPAWDLYDSIIAQQASIAAMLDKEALENPYSRVGKWWERQDIIDLATLHELASEIFRLISCCAAYESSDVENAIPLSIRRAQESIAGMLHPTAVHRGLEAHELAVESA